jgi:16S rRNA (guanine527-N7)-methyltransferase
VENPGNTEQVGPHWRLEKWFPKLPANVHQNLKIYRDELVKFNKTLNLISPKTIPNLDAIHFADSILATELIAPALKSNEVFDFGSGSGFPGLVMGILKPDLQINLVDSDQRKCEFLKHVVSALKVKNLKVLNTNVESLAPDSVRNAISRGYAPIARSLLSCRKVFHLNGIYFHMKSDEWANEVANMPTQLCSVWSPDLLGLYKLPVGDVELAVVKTEKIKA